ncbi:MAG: autotransporter outer membrane beta-barrel domain-containing protein, partial [Phycisphaeraceae bacterium JB051]
ENRGTITGNAANYLGNAAIQGIDTLFNYGTVDGSSNGVAIRCTDGDDDIYLYTGSEVYGSIEGQSEDATGDRIYFRDSDSSQYGNLRNNVYGFETATKQDAGTWTIRDTVTSFGVQTFDVDYGILVNDGIITVSDAFNINQGGMLNGRGTINGAGSVNVKEDGILAPNRSSYLDHISVSDQPRAQMSTIGTKTINTQLNLEAGSFLEIEVQGSEIDKVVANSVDIQGNLVIVPLVNAAEISDEELVFLESTALIDTQFASVDVHNIETDTITFDVIYYDNSVAIQKSVAAFEDKALTPNQKHIGRVLDNLPGGMGDLRNQMNLVGNGQLQKEMDRLRPNGAPIRTVFSNAQGFSQDSLQLARSVQQGNTRFAAAPGQSMLKQLNDDPYSLAQDGEQVAEQTTATDGKLDFFASPFGQFGDIDSSDARTGYSYDAYGAIIGLDYNCIPNMSLGLSLGYINTDISMDNSAGDSKVDTLRFGPYLTYTNGNWNVDASITGGFHWIDANRNTIMGTAESDYNSYDFTIYGATSYDMQLDKVTLSPTFSLTYVHQMTDDYAESGAGSANLTVEDMQTDSLQSLIGVHASMPVMIGNLALTPEAWIGWKYEWLDRDVDINSVFSANVTSPFTTTSQGSSRSQLVAGAAVFSQINEMTSIKLNYELNTASDVTIHSVWAMIELNF